MKTEKIPIELNIREYLKIGYFVSIACENIAKRIVKKSSPLISNAKSIKNNVSMVCDTN